MKLSICLAILVCLLCGNFAASPQMVNGIIAVVGDAVITVKDLQTRTEEDQAFLYRQFGSQPEILKEKLAALQSESIEEMVENELILQEFKRLEATSGAVIPDSYIQNRIQEDIKKYGDRLTLTQTLQAQGLTFERYRERIRERQILSIMWQQRVPHDPLISPAKIEKYYHDHPHKFKLQDQIKVRMIVLKDRPNDIGYSPIAVSREIVAKLKEGVPFAELAKTYSEDSFASQGGDRGWIERSVFRDEISSVAFSLAPGKFSDPIAIDGAIYILYVEDTKVSYTKTLAESRDEIEAILRAEETRRLRKQWIDELKSKAFVAYF